MNRTTASFGVGAVGLLAFVAIMGIVGEGLQADRNAEASGETDYAHTSHYQWTLIPWVSPDVSTEQALADAGLSAVVSAVYGWDGEEQRWRSFFPDADIPGANDLLELEWGQAYWVAINDPSVTEWPVVLADEVPPPTATPEPEPTPTEEPEPTPTSTVEPELGELTVHYIDVGQADATLLEGPDFAILIDAGHFQRNDVVPYLETINVEDIDLLIGTHPHADHIGQFPQVLDSFTVNEVWMSGYEHDTQTFENAMDAIDASDATYQEPRTTETRSFGDAELTVLNPPDASGDIHEMSISVRIDWGDVSFMFTGDAEEQTEAWMVDEELDLEAQIYQVGHHGSTTSSTQGFLDAMDPEVAIYSAGEGNTYGHPHDEVIDRLHANGIDIYGTDLYGTVTVTTDGVSYTVETETGGGPLPPPDVTPTPTPTMAPGACEPDQVDINTASHDELQEIVHIGPDRATQIIDLRPFASVDDLINVSGIGPATLDDIKDQGLACVADG